VSPLTAKSSGWSTCSLTATGVIADVHVDLDEEFKLRLAAESRVKFLEGRVLAWQAVATVSFLIMLGGVFDLFWRWIR
jgi:hypothetical protein